MKQQLLSSWQGIFRMRWNRKLFIFMSVCSLLNSWIYRLNLFSVRGTSIYFHTLNSPPKFTSTLTTKLIQFRSNMYLYLTCYFSFQVQTFRSYKGKRLLRFFMFIIRVFCLFMFEIGSFRVKSSSLVQRIPIELSVLLPFLKDSLPLSLIKWSDDSAKSSSPNSRGRFYINCWLWSSEARSKDFIQLTVAYLQGALISFSSLLGETAIWMCYYSGMMLSWSL